TPAFSVYDATKAAIRSFARLWTVDLKHRKIRVNAISPGPTDTPVLRRLFENEQMKTPLLNTIHSDEWAVLTKSQKPSCSSHQMTAALSQVLNCS
ncbi:MAG: SDR family oxidoreductase, partial [Candidatus Nitrosopolaris sp.]